MTFLAPTCSLVLCQFCINYVILHWKVRLLQTRPRGPTLLALCVNYTMSMQNIPCEFLCTFLVFICTFLLWILAFFSSLSLLTPSVCHWLHDTECIYVIFFTYIHASLYHFATQAMFSKPKKLRNQKKIKVKKYATYAGLVEEIKGKKIKCNR